MKMDIEYSVTSDSKHRLERCRLNKKHWLLSLHCSN